MLKGLLTYPGVEDFGLLWTTIKSRDLLQHRRGSPDGGQPTHICIIDTIGAQDTPVGDLMPVGI
jgi:hypothetical protein